MDAVDNPAMLGLQPDVFFTRSENVFIFLDLRRDRYFRLSEAQSRVFEDALNGDDAPRSNRDALQELLNRLGREGIIRRRRPGDAPLAPCNGIRRDSSTLDYPNRLPRQVRIQHVPPFLWALVTSWVLTLARPLRANVAALRRRRARRRPPIGCRLDEILTTFHTLTPVFFSTHDKCLFRSLVLVRYLDLFGVPAAWVYGVKFDPFLAHCWVQESGRVLNDHLERVSEFDPIMIVEASPHA